MSTLRVNTLQNVAGTGDPSINGAAKAWVNFNGTGTVAIRASFNVSSITDNGTGDYTVNFTTAMVDANYSPQVTGKTDGAGTGFIGLAANAVQTTTAFRVLTIDDTAQIRDTSQISVAVFR
jgi:nitrogen-specific signal transduction histidine kinase